MSEIKIDLNGMSLLDVIKAYPEQVLQAIEQHNKEALRVPDGAAGDAVSLAKEFHRLYEEMAPSFGYRTRKECAVPWDQLPDNNRNLMIAACERVISWQFAVCHSTKKAKQ